MKKRESCNGCMIKWIMHPHTQVECKKTGKPNYSWNSIKGTVKGGVCFQTGKNKTCCFELNNYDMGQLLFGCFGCMVGMDASTFIGSLMAYEVGNICIVVVDCIVRILCFVVPAVYFLGGRLYYGLWSSLGCSGHMKGFLQG